MEPHIVYSRIWNHILSILVVYRAKYCLFSLYVGNIVSILVVHGATYCLFWLCMGPHIVYSGCAWGHTLSILVVHGDTYCLSLWYMEPHIVYLHGIWSYIGLLSFLVASSYSCGATSYSFLGAQSAAADDDEHQDAARTEHGEHGGCGALSSSCTVTLVP